MRSTSSNFLSFLFIIPTLFHNHLPLQSHITNTMPSTQPTESQSARTMKFKPAYFDKNYTSHGRFIIEFLTQSTARHISLNRSAPTELYTDLIKHKCTSLSSEANCLGSHAEIQALKCKDVTIYASTEQAQKVLDALKAHLIDPNSLETRTEAELNEVADQAGLFKTGHLGQHKKTVFQHSEL